MDIYKDCAHSFEERAADLVSKMTLDEKIDQIGNKTSAIPRLGVPDYDYNGEASHGLMGTLEKQAMDVTSFPVCLAMSQSWNTKMVKDVTSAISDEIRAHHNRFGIELHVWSPTINLARDPRNGRSDENFGEDPYLAGKLAASYVQGMQGSDDKYIKVVSAPKHFALNSSENNRHSGSSNVDEATIREYYAKVFEYAIREGHAESLMASYNRINGVPATANEFMLNTLLREEWGFDGYVCSDGGAIGDCYTNPMFSGRSNLSHYYCKNMEEAVAAPLTAGTDMCDGFEYAKYAKRALETGHITEDDIDRAAIRIITSRFRLGLFDPPENTSYTSIAQSHACSEEIQELAVNIANESIVLLKNDKKLLPMDKKQLKSILVVGPNALYRQLGGYSTGRGLVDTIVNIMSLDGIRNEVSADNIEVKYEKGWCLAKEKGAGGIAEMLKGLDPKNLSAGDLPKELLEGLGIDLETMDALLKSAANGRHVPNDPDYQGDDEVLFARALAAAKTVDAVVVIAGTDDATSSEEKDRETLELPYNQDAKIQQLLEANENTVVVLTTLGAVTGDFIEKSHTLLNAHFAGQAQGTAIANLLFGKVNPSAKLSSTWYANLKDLPHINDYGIKAQDTYNNKSRTYMYFDGPVLFPFGYGLSYTTFEYGSLKVDKEKCDANNTVKLTLDVANVGAMDGAEIVQLYVSKVLPPDVKDNKPKRQLKGFKKVWITLGETKQVTFELPLKEIAFWNNFHRKMIVENGRYRLEIGRSSADIVGTANIEVTGAWDAALSTIYAVADKYIYNAGDSGHIHVSATLEDATHLQTDGILSFNSADEKVASVDENGNILAHTVGATTITATVRYGSMSKSIVVPLAVK